MPQIPVDAATGLQSGMPVHTGTVDVLVGWLVTHADGTSARLGIDRARADAYLRSHRGVAIEAMFVRRVEMPNKTA